MIDHGVIEGNIKANVLARRTTEDNGQLPESAKTMPISVIYGKAKTIDLKLASDELSKAKAGKHLQEVDKALSRKHTKKMHHPLDRTAASFLCSDENQHIQGELVFAKDQTSGD